MAAGEEGRQDLAQHGPLPDDGASEFGFEALAEGGRFVDRQRVAGHVQRDCNNGVCCLL